VERLDDAGTEHVCGFEGEFQEVVLGFAFDASPHGTAMLGAVGAGSGDVDECHAGVEFCEGSGCGEGEVVGDVGVLLLGHSGGGHSEAEEAGVVAGQVGLDG
jgi:hypothetical protein